MFSPANFVSVSRGDLQPRRKMKRKGSQVPGKGSLGERKDKELTFQMVGTNFAGTSSGLRPAPSIELSVTPALLSQSSHPDIGSHANSVKTNAETFFNRHTFAVFVSNRHESLFNDLSQPLSPAGSSFPSRKGSQVPGEGSLGDSYSSHAGGCTRSNSMKTKPIIFSSRHTHAICAPRVTCPPEIESPCSDFENLRPARIMSDAKPNDRASEEGAWPQR